MKRSLFVISIVLGMSLGARDANAATVVLATETTNPENSMGLANDVTSLFINGALLCTANEDAAACGPVAQPGPVPETMISPNFRGGGFFGVNLLDGPASPTITCNPAGTIDPSCSDQLYLTVTPIDATGNVTLTWCWDSDREVSAGGTAVICPVGNPNGITNLMEPASGYIDLTSNFTGPNGPLVAGQWTVTALSEAPEPASLFLVGIGLVAAALRLRKHPMIRPPHAM